MMFLTDEQIQTRRSWATTAITFGICFALLAFIVYGFIAGAIGLGSMGCQSAGCYESVDSEMAHINAVFTLAMVVCGALVIGGVVTIARLPKSIA